MSKIMYNYGIPFYEADLEVASGGLSHGSLDKTCVPQTAPAMASAAGPHKCPAPLCDERFQELHILQSMLNDLDKNLKDLRESKCLECSHARHSPSSSRAPCQSGKWCRTKSGFENVIGSVKRALSFGKRTSRKDQVQQPSSEWPSPTHPVSIDQMWEEACARNLHADLVWPPELSGLQKPPATGRPELPGLDMSPPPYDLGIGRQPRTYNPAINTQTQPRRAELEVLGQSRAELDSNWHNRSSHSTTSYATPPSKSHTGVSVYSQYGSSQASSYDIVSPWSSMGTNSTSTSSLSAPSSLDTGFGQFTASPDAYGPSEKLPWDVRPEPSTRGSEALDQPAAELPGNAIHLGEAAPTAPWLGLPGPLGGSSLPHQNTCSFEPVTSSALQEKSKSRNGISHHLLPTPNSDLLMTVADQPVGLWGEGDIDYPDAFSQENTLVGGFEGLDPAWQAELHLMLPKVPLNHFHRPSWDRTMAEPEVSDVGSVEQPVAEQLLVNPFAPSDPATHEVGEIQPVIERRDSVCCRACHFFPDDGPDQRKKIARHRLTTKHRRKTGEGSDSSESFSCQICKKTYNRRDNLVQHAKAHSANNIEVRLERPGVQMPRGGANAGLHRRDAKRRPPSDTRKYRL